MARGRNSFARVVVRSHASTYGACYAEKYRLIIDNSICTQTNSAIMRADRVRLHITNKEMKTNVTEWEFVDAFMQSDTYKNNFSRSGLKALYEYLTQYEEDADTEIELDIVAICCDFSEYSSAWEAMEQYQPEDMPTIDMEEHAGASYAEMQELQEQAALEWLQDRTTVIPFDGRITLHDGTVLGDAGVIIQQF